MFFVYVLYFKSHNKIYIGYTSNLEQRLISHNSLSKKGYTIKFRPWILVHSEKFISKKEAMIREKELKSSRGRAFIKKSILQDSYPSADGRQFNSLPRYISLIH